METAQLLSVACIAKPIILVSILIGLRKFYDPLYASPQCAMRLVNETDPAAFSVHPFWKDVEYDDSCAGEALQQYRLNQFSTTEASLQQYMTSFFNVVSVIVMLWRFSSYKWSGVGTLARSFVAYFCCALFSATVVLCHCHFEQDVSFLTGAIIHHAEVDSPGLNLGKGTISQGYLVCGFVNRLFYACAILCLVKLSNLHPRLDPWVLVSLLNLGVWFAVSTVKHKHTVYHEIATREMASSWPYTFENRAYKHAIVHHESGESFSGDPFLDPLFDAQLYAFGWLHNSVLNIKLASPAHYAFSAAFDVFSGLSCVGVLFATLRFAAWIAPEAPATRVATKKVN